MSGIIGEAGSKSGVIGTTELDYEEGIYTPTVGSGFSGPGYTSDTYGRYTVVGNRCFCDFVIQLDGSGTDNTGTIYSYGLPFDIDTDKAIYQFNMNFVKGSDGGTQTNEGGPAGCVGSISSSGNAFSCRMVTQTGADYALWGTSVGDNGKLTGTFHYRILTPKGDL